MIATVEVIGLRITACHGVIEQERVVGNEFEVTVRLDYQVDKAALQDDISAAINYATVVQVVKAEMSRPAKLLEHVAWRIKRSLSNRFAAITGGEVRVAKITPPFKARLTEVAVTLRW